MNTPVKTAGPWVWGSSEPDAKYACRIDVATFKLVTELSQDSRKWVGWVLLNGKKHNFEGSTALEVGQRIDSVLLTDGWALRSTFPVDADDGLQQPKTPVTAQRVVASLSKNPQLAWDVAQALLVLGPWEHTLGTAWFRATPQGGKGALIDTTTGDPTHLSLFSRIHGHETHFPLGLPILVSDEELFRTADTILREQGFTLLDLK